jgi:RNA polymerase sigma-70 factor (ECF subfamily)
MSLRGHDVSADETALVRRCLEGRQDSIRQLIERFQADVFGLCVRLLNHRHDAEDVTQEVFLRVFRSLRRWDSTRPLKPWIMGITVNRCRTWMSQRSRRPGTVDYLQETAARDDRDDSSELVAEIRTALGELRPDYRAVFVMFHEQGQSYEDIALAMERPVGTIKTWLHRARLEVLDQLRRRGMLPDANIPADRP